MTNREFLAAIANMENISEELKNEATARIEKMDAVNEARKNKPSKKTKENEAVRLPSVRVHRLPQRQWKQSVPQY